MAAAKVDISLAHVLGAAVDAASDAVARTPHQLPALADAGVVDAGGRGLELLLRGALQGMADGATQSSTAPGGRGPPVVDPEGVDPAGDAGWGYETMYLLTARQGTRLDIEAMRSALATMGESLLVVGDAQVARVHLHSERPDLVIGYGLRRGAVSRVTVENMDLLSAGEREERAAELMGAPITASGEATAAGRRAPTVGRSTVRSAFAVVAVAVGAGLVATFEAAGVRPLVPGGQGANPSVGEFLEAIKAANADTLVVLPNDPDGRLAAEQTARLATGVEVLLVASRNAAEGLAAALAVDPRADAASNVARMRRAAASIRTCVITTAAQDARHDGRAVTRGQAIAMGPDGALIAVGHEQVTVALEAIRTLSVGVELVSIHYGADVTRDEAESLRDRVAGVLPEVLVEVFPGGQPHAAFLVAAE